jgi:hypothetical protein
MQNVYYHIQYYFLLHASTPPDHLQGERLFTYKLFTYKTVHSQLCVKSAAHVHFNRTVAVLYVNNRSP